MAVTQVITIRPTIECLISSVLSLSRLVLKGLIEQTQLTLLKCRVAFKLIHEETLLGALVIISYANLMP